MTPAAKAVEAARELNAGDLLADLEDAYGGLPEILAHLAAESGPFNRVYHTFSGDEVAAVLLEAAARLGYVA